MPGSLVLVDGWNHYMAALRCFGYASAARFPIDRLAAHLTARTEADKVADAAVVMAIPNRNNPAELADFEQWRRRLHWLKNHGVRHEKVKFAPHSPKCSHCAKALTREVACEACGTKNQIAARRKEKGADVKVAALAIEGACQASYATLILLSQDRDFSPLVRQLKEIHQRQGRRYDIWSAYPVCDNPQHNHTAVPGAKSMEITAADYAMLAARPRQDPRTTGP